MDKAKVSRKWLNTQGSTFVIIYTGVDSYDSKPYCNVQISTGYESIHIERKEAIRLLDALTIALENST